MDERTLVHHLKQILSKKGFTVKTELGAGYGVADLVMMKVNKNKWKIRNKNRQRIPLLKESYFMVLSNIPDYKDLNTEPIELNDLLRKTCVSRTFLKNHLLRDLQEFGYVENVGGNRFVKINGWVPLSKEVIAIEAKLENWQRGLIQANRYKSFADKVYLAVPECFAHRVNRDALRSKNIGFFVLRDNKKSIIEEISASKNSLYNDDKRNFIIEKCLLAPTF